MPELGQVLGENPIGLGLALKRDGGFESGLLQQRTGSSFATILENNMLAPRPTEAVA